MPRCRNNATYCYPQKTPITFPKYQSSGPRQATLIAARFDSSDSGLLRSLNRRRFQRGWLELFLRPLKNSSSRDGAEKITRAVVLSALRASGSNRTHPLLGELGSNRVIPPLLNSNALPIQSR